MHGALTDLVAVDVPAERGGRVREGGRAVEQQEVADAVGTAVLVARDAGSLEGLLCGRGSQGRPGCS